MRCGRVALYKDEATGQPRLSYQLLNAAAHFQDILEHSHAVVLAGGTMQPMSGIFDRYLIHTLHPAFHTPHPVRLCIAISVCP